MAAVSKDARRALRLRSTVLLALVAIPILTWLFVPSPLVRGLATGFALGPLMVLGGLAVFARRMQSKLSTGLQPPPLPQGAWDYAMTATTLDGEEVEFSRFVDRVLVLNFWATWCGPCVAEMPSLSRLRDATADAAVSFACITREPEDVVRKFLEKHPLGVPIYLLDGDPPASFKSAAIPATFVLDRHGTIALQHRGAAAWDHPSIVNFVHGLAVTPG